MQLAKINVAFSSKLYAGSARITHFLCSQNYVIDSYFPATFGNHVTLYQGTETPTPPCPRLDKSVNFQQTSVWRDIYQAIIEAKKFIYVAGQQYFRGRKLL